VKKRRVVVTGYGSLTSLGENSAEAWQSIMDYKLGYSPVELSDRNIKAKYFALIELEKKRYHNIDKSILRAIPMFAKNALVAATEAMHMAFGDPSQLSENYEPHSCGVIIGTGWGGLDESYDIRDDYRDTGYGNPFGSLITMPSIASGACSLLWNLRGYQNTVIAACATGTIAIGDAYEIIRSGRAEMMLAGGSESMRSETNIWNIDVLNALSKEQSHDDAACCPFDMRRSGFVLAEGSAVLCLEEMEQAQKRGATILGEITGYGNYSDATDFTSPAKDMLARSRTILTALKQAGKQPNEIDYINAHGTSTTLNDLNETNSIKLSLGEASYKTPISSTKSYSGHLISAAGSFESIICLKTIEHHILPGTINLNYPDPDCDLNYLPNQHVQVDQVDTTLNLSFGFGGTNAALIIERVN